MKQFNWTEMKEFWRIHGSSWSHSNDFEKDPDGLNVVLYPGGSRWLNRYFAHFQKKIFLNLLKQVQREHSVGSALDIGCGAGRWARLLKENGFDVIGIDLQQELTEKNKKRHPDINFICGSIQDYNAGKTFDLVSSVTVLQHLPYEEQKMSVQKIRSLTKTNGYALILENIEEIGPHVFSNSIPSWLKIFKEAKFKPVLSRRYDYSPCFRMHAWAARKIAGSLGWRKETLENLSPKDFAFIPQNKKSFLHLTSDSIRDGAILLDWGIELSLVCLQADYPSLHNGFLFQAI